MSRSIKNYLIKIFCTRFHPLKKKVCRSNCKEQRTPNIEQHIQYRLGFYYEYVPLLRQGRNDIENTHRSDRTVYKYIIEEFVKTS